MRIEELITPIPITEESYRADEIGNILRRKGYKMLGRPGADQTAYLEPGTGKVLKIFGSDENYGEQHSDAQRMFKVWINYCKKNSSNQFLPKFDGWEGFEIDGEKYLQIRMERLQPLPDDLGQLLSEIADRLASGINSVARIQGFIKTVGDRGKSKDEDSEYDPLNELAILLGEQQFTLLLHTIADLARIGRNNSWRNDLHDKNFMHRNNGIPVIVDPWYQGESY